LDVAWFRAATGLVWRVRQTSFRLVSVLAEAHCELVAGRLTGLAGA